MSTTPNSLSGWRPPQWSTPAMIAITVPAGYTTTVPNNTPVPVDSNGVGIISTKKTAPTSYVFDAVLSLDHEQTLTKTKHPVQTGAAVSSHAYIEPASLVMYVLMSDVVPQFSASNQTVAPYIQQWTGNPSKSVSAFQQVLALQAARIPLTVTTRLRNYTNMLILRVSPHEDNKSITGARFRIEFEQLFIANTQANPISARPNDTQSTGLGAVNVQPPPASIPTQFSTTDIPSTKEPGAANGLSAAQNANLYTWLGANPQGVNVPGAGDYSSVNTNSLQQLPSP